MIEARLSAAALAAGLQAPALMLIRRIALRQDAQAAFEDEIAALTEEYGPAPLTQLMAGSPFAAKAGAASRSWLPGGEGGDATRLWRSNFEDACLIAALEAGLPALLHDARDVLEDLAIDVTTDGKGAPAIGLFCGERLLSTLSAAGCSIDPQGAIRPDTGYLLLFVPGNARTNAAASRAVCLRAVRLLRRSCPQVYAQIILVHRPPGSNAVRLASVERG